MEPSHEAPSKRTPPRGPSQRTLIWWTIWLVLISSALIHLPYEVSYWMLALAEQASQEKRFDDAWHWMESAKQWVPESTLPVALEVQLLYRQGKDDPLAPIDDRLKTEQSSKTIAALLLRKSALLAGEGKLELALEALDKAAEVKGNLRPSVERAHLLLQLDRQDEAKREMAQMLKKHQEQEREFKFTIFADQKDNNIAYYLALVNENLDIALHYADQALQDWPDEPNILDTRGYVYYRLGQTEKSLEDLNKSIELLKKREAEGQRKTPRGGEAQALAVILYHRSLVLDKLGKSAEAEQDRQTVKELGFQPGPLLF
jgi:tetratricopeptide (TPR) repeat protein